MTNPTSDSRIIILGAGPSGLFTAYYLKKNGYKNVLVLEKEGHVGGLCRTINSQNKAFDLGANYVTPAYKLTLKLAREVGAKLYSEDPFVAMTVPDDANSKVSYQPMIKAVMVDHATGKKIPLLKFLGDNLRFIWIRFKLRKIVDKPTFSRIEEYDGGSLCVPFLDWLKNNKIESLATSFDVPITMMGFGYLKNTPAVYALKFMTLSTFIPMMIKQVPFIGKLYWWPKRFKLGYQRLWERVAAGLNVRLNVAVTSIKRDMAKGKISLKVETNIENFNAIKHMDQEIVADYLIMACPLKPWTNDEVMTLDKEEKDLFKDILITSYCMTTLSVRKDPKCDLTTDAPLAAIFPVKDLTKETPTVTYGVAKQWKDNGLVQFYTSTFSTDEDYNVRPEVDKDIAKLSAQMCYEDIGEEGWRTFNRWTYFQHVNHETMLGKPKDKDKDKDKEPGWYTRLENLQGKMNTFYVGGATNFELIEPIGNYAKNLVDLNFPKQR